MPETRWSAWSEPVPFDAGDGHQYVMRARYREVPPPPPRPWWRRLLDWIRH